MKKETKFSHISRPKIGIATPVNHNITKASTLLFNKSKDLYRSDIRGYGRHGSEIHDALAHAFNVLEDGVATTIFPSGLAACTVAILSLVKTGDHVLLTDSSYGPIKKFCMQFLSIMGIETELYNPRIGCDIEKLIKKSTRLIIMESPGSLSFEIQDVPAIVKIAKKNKIFTLIDNTWSAGLSFKPLNHGVDISCHAATKYFGGHSDIMCGVAISRTKEIAKKVKQTATHLGNSISPDDVYGILRGFRTLVTRFKQQEETSLSLAKWLNEQSKVSRVIHPAHISHPDHELWKRDFTGGGCIFSAVFKPCSEDEVNKFIDRLELFGIGFSYGGYESLCINCDPQLIREKSNKLPGPLIRFACGLENLEDLKIDIEKSLLKLKLA